MMMMLEAMMSLLTALVGEGGKMRGGWFFCEDMAWEEEEGWRGRKVDLASARWDVGGIRYCYASAASSLACSLYYVMTWDGASDYHHAQHCGLQESCCGTSHSGHYESITADLLQHTRHLSCFSY
jgi:hypothetical protein